jgi:hypothetical protein
MRMAAFGVIDSLAAAAAVGVLAASAAVAQIQDTRTSNPRDLRPLASFSGISDQAERSRALFNEIAKVVTHPRCMNCHPAGNHPLQGDDRHEHLPPVPRGDAGLGVAGLNCATCHTERNFTLVGAATYKSIPGHPRWQLAPIEMAWEGKSVSQICQQLKDPARNGGRTLALLHEHFAKDDLVAWGWAPGEGREPAPGNQQQLGELAQAWIDSGAQCP